MAAGSEQGRFCSCVGYIGKAKLDNDDTIEIEISL